MDTRLLSLDCAEIININLSIRERLDQLQPLTFGRNGPRNKTGISCLVYFRSFFGFFVAAEISLISNRRRRRKPLKKVKSGQKGSRLFLAPKNEEKKRLAWLISA